METDEKVNYKTHFQILFTFFEPFRALLASKVAMLYVVAMSQCCKVMIQKMECHADPESAIKKLAKKFLQ